MLDPEKTLLQLKKLFQLCQLNPRVHQLLAAQANEPLFLACSGGADSLFLLYLIKAHFSDRPLYVLHFNHGIRTASAEEEYGVRQHAEILGLKIFIGKRQKQDHYTEASLREERYAFFLNVLSRLNGRYLLLGHHGDDVIESMLMRLFYGSGLTGLSSPKPVQTFFDGHVRLRPLLNTSKKEIQNILQSLQLTWFEDSTNADPTACSRNQIRQQLIPFLDTLIKDRNWRKGISRSRSLLEEEDTAAEFNIEKLWASAFAENRVFFDALRGQPKAYYRRILWRWLLLNQKTEFLELKSSAIDVLVDHIFNGQNYQLTFGENQKLVFTKNVLSHETLINLKGLPIWPKYMLVPKRNEKIFFPSRKCLTIEHMILDDALKRDILNGLYSNREIVFLDGLEKCTVRQWEDGDRYQPIGSSSSKKVKKLFSDHKFDIKTKHTLPIVCHTDGRILWCPGLPPSEAFKIRQHSTECVRLMYR